MWKGPRRTFRALMEEKLIRFSGVRKISSPLLADREKNSGNKMGTLVIYTDNTAHYYWL